MTAKELAKLIQDSPEFIGGKQKVVLYSCETGKMPDGIAQQLADLLGVVVEAPNAHLFPQKTGGFFVGYLEIKCGRRRGMY